MRHRSGWGDSWIYLDRQGAPVLAIDPRAPDRLWLGGGAVGTTDDGAASYKIRLEGLGGMGGFAFLESGTYVFGGRDTLVAFRSPDRGEHWHRLRVPPGVQGAISVAVDPSGRVLIGTRLTGVWRYTPE
jgi:hypothetical protein